MSLAEQELGALALETALEEVGAELQQVLRLLLEHFAVEVADFVGVIGRQRHWDGREGGRARRRCGYLAGGCCVRWAGAAGLLLALCLRNVE